MTDRERERLMAELVAQPKERRLDWLADLPRDRLQQYKRILGREDIRKLNEHIDRRIAASKAPTVESWLAEARAGKATSPDAMIEVLREIAPKLRDTDALWVDRIATTAAGRSFSRKQLATLRGIYARYFRPEDAD